jgi:hypothetical protein
MKAGLEEKEMRTSQDVLLVGSGPYKRRRLSLHGDEFLGQLVIQGSERDERWEG